ncbi:MAG: hypothetical protein ACOCP4_02410 [Candidatus Woesearchaeota archaeon]
MSSLQQRSVVGIAWNLTERFGIYFIKFALGVILARLLTPEAFGLVGWNRHFQSFSLPDVPEFNVKHHQKAGQIKKTLIIETKI